jgi:hypothetical protein
MKSVTPYVEYESTDQAAGSMQRREVMVTPATYDALAMRPTVTVEYLRSKPSWNRLAGGLESGERAFGGVFLLLTGGMTLVLATIGVLTFLGYDIRTENDKTKITRHGQPLGRDADVAPSAPTAPPAVAPPPIASAVQVPLAPAKPVGLIALGIVAIVFGLIGLFLGVVRVVLMRLGTIELANGRFIEFDSAPWRIAWTLADTALAAALVVVGIGLILTRRWSRTLGLLVAALQLLSTIGNFVVIIMTMFQAPEIEGAEGVRQSANHLAAAVGTLLGGVLPLVMLLVLSRRSTVEALADLSTRAMDRTGTDIIPGGT